LQNNACGLKPLGPLFTDLYELTMLAGYYADGRQHVPAVFEYFFRRLPENAGFCVFAGMDDLLDDLADFRFTDSDIEYLASLKLFPDAFPPEIRDFSFRGDIWAPPEGTPVFPYEPVVRVQAPLAQAQVIETLLLCRLNYQTLIATKASRVMYAAEGDQVMEFGLRRAQGPDGGMSGSRAAIIGGCDATSNTQAGKCFGVPAIGTQAHSWIMAFDSELEAFRAYARVFPDHLVLLVDTYDTMRSGVPNAIIVFKELRRQGWKGRPGIRIDSGDLAELSKKSYRMLADAGFGDALIVASSDLDEYVIADIKRRGGKANSWGVGTRLITGGSEPALTGVYKLSAIFEDDHWRDKLKISDDTAKTTDPGIKMPIRFYDPDGFITGDVLFGRGDDSWQSGEVLAHDRAVEGNVRGYNADLMRRPILEPVMRGGRRLIPRRELMDIRGFAREQIAHIPDGMRQLLNPRAYPVGLSERIAREKRDVLNERPTFNVQRPTSNPEP
jgi:nicotinate phosphoribosyltransferase